MTKAETTPPLEREEDAVLSIQNAFTFLLPVTKRSPSHCTINTMNTSLTVSSSSCDDSNNDDADDSSEHTVDRVYMEQAVINSIAETLSSQEDAPECDEKLVDGFYLEQAVLNSIAETLLSQEEAPECDERPERVALESISISSISDLPHAVEDEVVEAAPSGGSLLSQMFFSCMGGSVLPTTSSVEPQRTGQDTATSVTRNYNYRFPFGFSPREPPPLTTSGLAATNLVSKFVTQRKSYNSKGRWRRMASQRRDTDDASRKTDKTDKTRRSGNTSKEKKRRKRRTLTTAS
jgi:hypothetical protein